jgi:hypothetical protein
MRNCLSKSPSIPPLSPRQIAIWNLLAPVVRLVGENDALGEWMEKNGFSPAEPVDLALAMALALRSNRSERIPA